MADYYTSGTVMPEIPAKLITKNEKEIISKFLNHDVIKSNKEVYLYLYSHEYSNVHFDEDENEISEDDLFKIFQRIINRSKGKLLYIYLMFAGTCSKMRPDSHGGSAVFITANNIKYFSTWSWVDKQLKNLKRRVT